MHCRTLKFEAKLESSLSYFIVKRWNLELSTRRSTRVNVIQWVSMGFHGFQWFSMGFKLAAPHLGEHFAFEQRVGHRPVVARVRRVVRAAGPHTSPLFGLDVSVFCGKELCCWVVWWSFSDKSGLG